MSSLIDKSGNLVYFGRLSWGNFLDWLITLCLSWIVILGTSALGGVRPEAHAALLPWFMILLVLHGIWYAVEDEVPTRLNHVPLLFIPFLGFVALSADGLSPVTWRGVQMLVYLVEAFIFLWVVSNNARTRAHVWFLLVAALLPVTYGVVVGFYQFFQTPTKIVDGLTGYPVMLSKEYLGRATGTFADPYSFAQLLLIFLPVVLFAGSVPRLRGLLRVLSYYMALMIVIALVLTQVLWAYALLALMLLLVPWFVHRKMRKRLTTGAVSLLVLVVIFLVVFLYNPIIQESALQAMSVEGEGVRRVLWPEALAASLGSLVWGHGAGSYSWMIEQGDGLAMARLPESPLSDVLLLLAEFGLLGLLLVLVPLVWILWQSYRMWKTSPHRVTLVLLKKMRVMPPQRFFLSVGLLGSAGFIVGAVLQGVLHVPALMLSGMLFLGLLSKTAFKRRLSFPDRLWMRIGFLCACVFIALGFRHMAEPRLAAQAIELEARQDFEELLRQRVHLSGNANLLDQVIERFRKGTQLDPENADLWLGLSAAEGQLFFRNPSRAYTVGQKSLESAQRALELSPEYARAWSQVGVAYALMGEDAEAEEALLRALELAPSSSNAHYYWAVFASHFPDKLDSAKVSAQRAIQINPDNDAAKRLYRKLQIL